MPITVESGVTINGGIAIGDIPVLGGGLLTHTVTRLFNGAVSNTQVKFGTGSFSSLPSGGGLKVLPVTDLAFGTGDFTIEFWMYQTTRADTNIVDFRPQSTNGMYPTIGASLSDSIFYYTNNAFRIQTTTTVAPLNTWQSFALVRYAGNTKLYIDGVQQGSTYPDTNNYLAGKCIIGCNGFEETGSLSVKGYLDEIRISNIARYTSNYTPATSAFWPDNYTKVLIHCDGANGSTAFVDSSSAI